MQTFFTCVRIVSVRFDRHAADAKGMPNAVTRMLGPQGHVGLDFHVEGRERPMVVSQWVRVAYRGIYALV